MIRYKAILELVEDVRALLSLQEEPKRSGWSTSRSGSRSHAMKAQVATSKAAVASALQKAKDPSSKAKHVKQADKQIAHHTAKLTHLQSIGTAKKHIAHVQGKFKQTTKHSPFKYVKKGKGLGPAVRGSTTNPGKKKGYWKCRCASYRCHCKGSEGEKKVVHIDHGYKNTYNIAYRKWRKKHAAKYLPSKGGVFMKRPGKKAPKSASM